MSVWKKNFIALAILVTVCTGIYLNWLYSDKEILPDLVDTLSSGEFVTDPAEIQDIDAEDTITDYFAAVRLSRQQARDSALGMLQEAMAYGDEADNTSSEKMDAIIETALNEAQIESLVIAKGYTDCVAYMNDSGISVAVAAPEGGLQKNDVALIADIVMSQSNLTLEDIRVVEVQ